MPITVSSINIYPVKSTAARPLAQATVLAAGLEHDRRWMLVDDKGDFLTGREHPDLVCIRVTPHDGGLLLEAPGRESLIVNDASGLSEPLAVTVWRDQVDVRRVNPAADAWFSRQLGMSCSLVVMPDDTRRPVDPDHSSPGDHVSFADGFPLLLIGDASLDDLNKRTPDHAEMGRFRPNLTVTGCPAFAEDGWRQIRVGDVVFDIPKPCDRCVMTTVDPATGIKDAALEPLRTLSGYRRDREQGILFGVNLIPRGQGTVSVDDAVTILNSACPETPWRAFQDRHYLA